MSTKTTKAEAKNTGELIGQLLATVGHYVHLETSDGMRREGKCTGFTTREMKFNGQVICWPDELELNGDPVDLIPVNRIDILTAF